MKTCFVCLCFRCHEPGSVDLNGCLCGGSGDHLGPCHSLQPLWREICRSYSQECESISHSKLPQNDFIINLPLSQP